MDGYNLYLVAGNIASNTNCRNARTLDFTRLFFCSLITVPSVPFKVPPAGCIEGFSGYFFFVPL